MYKKVAMLLALPVLLSNSCVLFAAQSIELDNQPVGKLRYFTQRHAARLSENLAQDNLKEIKRSTDFNGTTHIRAKQTYHNVPVWGGDVVVHVRRPALSAQSVRMLAASADAKSADLSGTIYQGLAEDLQGARPAAMMPDVAFADVLKLVDKKYANAIPEEKNTQLMIYVDQDSQAHWAYHVSLYYPHSATHAVPSRPNFILDAKTLHIYKQWNDVQAEITSGMPGGHLKQRQLDEANLEKADGGGYGGNPASGRFVYDGLTGDLSELNIERHAGTGRCYLANSLAEVRDERLSREPVVSFPCQVSDEKHNHVFWDGSLDEVNEGYSPANDALYAGSVIKSLYKDWYHREMLEDEYGAPLKLKLMVHTPDDDGEGLENAFWDSRDQVIYLGDGRDSLYPLTSLGVIAHEVSHGFTQQHSGLVYESQSGGLNESFSDMAAMAAESFAYGKNTWMIGSEIFKVKGQALRYMDHPSRDCEQLMGDCSIENVKNYNERLNVHHTSGIFNRAFYLMANADGWDTRKAFDVMIQANANYWTATTTFKRAACGVLKATKDHGYDLASPLAAFKEVGISTSGCAV